MQTKSQFNEMPERVMAAFRKPLNPGATFSLDLMRR